jgi:hypothetical protein
MRGLGSLITRQEFKVTNDDRADLEERIRRQDEEQRINEQLDAEDAVRVAALYEDVRRKISEADDLNRTWMAERRASDETEKVERRQRRFKAYLLAVSTLTAGLCLTWLGSRWNNGFGQALLEGLGVALFATGFATYSVSRISRLFDDSADRRRSQFRGDLDALRDSVERILKGLWSAESEWRARTAATVSMERRRRRVALMVELKENEACAQAATDDRVREGYHKLIEWNREELARLTPSNGLAQPMEMWFVV